MKTEAFGGIFQGTAYGQCYGQYMYTYVSIDVEYNTDVMFVASKVWK